MVVSRIVSCITIVLFFITQGHSQQQNSLAVISKYKPDGVWLRWAPTEAANWQLGNQFGYQLERFTLLPSGDMEPNTLRTLTDTPLKPISEAEFEKLTGASAEAEALLELIYNKEGELNSKATDFASLLSKNSELENRFGFALLLCDLSLDAARTAGLFYVDKTAEKGKRYAYRIKLMSPKISVPPAVAIVNAVDPPPALQIKDLKAEFGNKKATLSWSTLFHKSVYTAYYVERSPDGKNFKRLSDLPYVQMSEKVNTETTYFVDSLEANQKTYYYRISGVSPFAETGPYSNLVSGEGHDDLTGLLIIREGNVLEKNKVKLTWEFPAEVEKQIAGFHVTQAASPDGPYLDAHKKPLSKGVREYIHETTHNNTYYKIRAIDKNGKEVARSFPYLVQIADEAPPAMPVSLRGIVDKNGQVDLSWAANAESDLLGYRVFRTNSLKEEFTEVTNTIIPKPQFRDSINIKVLNKNIYYSVVAVDKNFNPSGYSQSLLLKRPDMIAPAVPVFTRSDISRDTVLLAWHNSVSDDVVSHQLIRIDVATNSASVVTSWLLNTPRATYSDNTLKPGSTYVYKILATDSSGNSSEAVSRKIYFEPGFRKASTALKGTPDREAKKIMLTWKNSQPGLTCIIYRKVNNDAFKIFTTLEGNVESFTDKSISPNNVYYYKIQPVFEKGVKALISDDVKVVY